MAWLFLLCTAQCGVDKESGIAFTKTCIQGAVVVAVELGIVQKVGRTRQ